MGSNLSKRRQFSANESGASMLEFAVLLPLLLVVSLGLVDLGLVMFASTSVDRATQYGARYVATNAPMANGIDKAISASSGAISGTSCIPVGGVSACTLNPSYTCSYSSTTTGTCTGSDGTSLTIDSTRFNALVSAMQTQLDARTLDKRQVIVTYTPLQQGYVGRPKTPMNVKLTLRCVKQELFFIDDLLGWALPTTGCTGLPNPGGFSLNYSSTLPSEDLEGPP